MELRHIPLSELRVAAVNMRHGRRAPDISDILPSVRARHFAAAARPVEWRGL